jgi:uncharacterized repeat protein (TIGR01451 family)/LPXTG-motif cell wall-anchored protein
MAALAAGITTTSPPRAAVAQVPSVAPAPNPTVDDSCGVDVTLVLDASGSIQTSGAVGQVRGAADAFLDALTNTNSTARVTQFATVSEQLAASTLVTDSALASGGVLRDALNDYYNPKPPRPAGVNFYQYTGTNPASASSFQLNNATNNNQYTNWDQGLGQAAETVPELVVFVTDGDPTAYDFRAGDPIASPNVAFSTDRNASGRQVTLDRAVEAANVIKGASTRILAVGVGNALDNGDSRNRLVAVSGPQVVRDADLDDVDSLNEIDVALVQEFDDLAQFLRGVVLQLCSPSLTIRKLAQSPSDADYLPAPGWDVTATPDTENGQFDWILPDTAPATSKTRVTDGGGFAQFQWEPDPGEQDSSALVSEAIEPGYTPGRPAADDVRCELRDEDGDVDIRTFELTVAGTTASFELDPIGQEIVTCTIWNSFDYAPAIAITKVDDPTQVRGDLDPPAIVTATYEVTNPGNTPLRLASITDDTCGTITPGVREQNDGDADGDGLLDTTETWLFACSEEARISGGGPPVEVTNTVTVVGVDPAGTAVEDDASASVTIYVPEVTLTKLVDGEDSVTVAPGTEVTYTYAATNAGNTDLTGVTLVDDMPPCTAPTRGADDPGNDEDVMQPGETWTWSCTATASEPVVNTATVSGTPQIPGGGAFPDPNPPVTASDVAAVDVVDPDIDLRKSVDPEVVMLSEDPTDTEAVVYTFRAENTGDQPLNRPGQTGGGPGPTDPGWILDSQCTSPATYESGDADGNALLDPGETWQFTCPGLVGTPTVNVASITGEPPSGPLVSDLAVAFVDVRRPAIDVVKTALVPVVLDENIDPAPVAGPDVPDARPAVYLYDVTNTGNVALDVDPNPPEDDICSPLVPVPGAPGSPQRGDRNGDTLLGVNETWHYSCTTTLDREGDANEPAVIGDESGLVQNEVEVFGIPVLAGTSFPDKTVTDSDIAQVLVIEPGITLEKSASAAVVLADDTVTYTFTVRNTGDVGLDVIGPDDDKCSPLELIAGDENGNGLLDGANSGAQEAWTFQCTRAITLPSGDELTDVNSASVSGVDPLGNVYTATDDVEVRVFDPAIRLTKTVSETLVLTGSPVTYTFEVVSVGASPASEDDILADIQLVDISDPAVPSCLRPTFVGGDTDGDGLLPREPAETWTYACTATITEPTTDVAIVRGTGGTQFEPPLPIDVFDIDAQFVQPFSPAIEVTKTAAPTEVVGSGEVTYTYAVRNTGDVPLADVATRITDDTCAPVTYVSGDEDGDELLDTPTSLFEDALDEIWTFTCTATIDETTTNTVVVTGRPTDSDGSPLCLTPAAFGRSRLLQVPGGCDVTDEAEATVTVVAPGALTIVKRTTVATSATFSFTVGGTTFRLGRDGTRTISPVAPGRYTVTEGTATGWVLASLTCTDESGGSVTAIADRRATIDVAAGETVTCVFTNRPAGQLPSTGSELSGTLTLAAVALVGGALFVALGRRRRAH